MLIEYYQCDCPHSTNTSDNCDYRIARDDIDTEKITLTNHMVDDIQKVSCRECGRSYTKEVQIKKFICPKCGKDLMLKSIGNDEICENALGSAPQIMGVPYKVPIHSDALALTPDSVAEHKEKFPDIEIDSENRPVFTNAKQHDDYMKKCGIRKQTQRTGRSKGKIYSYPGSKCS